MIEVAALATTVVSSFLVPLMRDGAARLAEELRERTTETAADSLVDTARALWRRVRDRAAGTDEEPVVELFEQRPEQLADAVRVSVERLLSEDEALRQELSALVEAEEHGTARWQIMADTVGVVDLRGGHVSGGTVTGVSVTGGNVPGGRVTGGSATKQPRPGPPEGRHAAGPADG